MGPVHATHLIWEHKPADAHISIGDRDKAKALDITITDPTNKTALDRGSDRKPFVAAAVRHTVKLGTHKRALEEAGDQGVPFMKGPLVGGATDTVGDNCRDGCRPTHIYQEHPKADGRKGWSTRGQQTSSHRSGYRICQCHMPGCKQSLYISGYIMDQDVIRIYSSPDRDLSEGPGANTASHLPFY